MPIANYFPVRGASARDFSNDWGAPRDGGSRQHKGTDIFAPHGTPVVAVTGGVITRAGYSGKGGLRLWINGKFYYAHLSRISVKEGQKVKPGQVIGFVGNSGNAKNTPPHLHFGYDPAGTHGQNWANPYSLLSKLVKGGQVRMGRGGTPIEDSPFSAQGFARETLPELPPMEEPILPTTPPLPNENLFTPAPPGTASFGYTPRRRAEAWQMISELPLASPETQAFARQMQRAADA